VIVLDTNVVSELMRRDPDPLVRAWMSSHPRRSRFLTSITVGEVLRGIDRLPNGKRRRTLEEKVEDILAVFADLVLPYDNEAAFAYADVVEARSRAGRPISECDAQIAAICRHRGAPLATRNVKDFELTGVELIDPWHAEP
jgi:predicted nucleic acid-binding protein